MSNRNRRTAATRTTAPKPQMPAPVGPGFQKGQQAARNILSEAPWEEWADLLAGFKSMAFSELNDRKAKVDEGAKNIDAAFKALNA